MTMYREKSTSQEFVSWLSFDLISAMVPFPGTRADWEDFVAVARQRGGTQGMSAMVLRWKYKGGEYSVDMNGMKVLMVHETRIDSDS